MESIYSQNFAVTDNCVDCFGNLKLSTLLYFAQEVAGRHFDRIAMTYDQLAKKGMFWAIYGGSEILMTAPTLSAETKDNEVLSC